MERVAESIRHGHSCGKKVERPSGMPFARDGHVGIQPVARTGVDFESSCVGVAFSTPVEPVDPSCVVERGDDRNAAMLPNIPSSRGSQRRDDGRLGRDGKYG